MLEIDGGFNYRRYLNSQNIYGIIDCSNIDILKLPGFHPIHELKKSIECLLFRLLPREYVGILEGMIIGDTSYISDETQNAFRDCGITHLLAVSGSNVAYVLLMCKFLFEKIFGRNVSNVLTIVFIIMFTILSGSSASVVRATIMAIIIIISEFVSEKPDTMASVCVSCILILLYNPIIIYDIGFILSFSGTLGIILLNGKISDFMQSFIFRYISLKNEFQIKVFRFIIETLSVTIAAQIAVTPITLYFFNSFSIVAILVNLVIVPMTGFVTILGIMMYLIGVIYFPFAKVLSFAIYSLISFMLVVTKIFSAIPFANVLVPTPSILGIITYYFFLFRIFFCIRDSNHISIIDRLIYILISILIVSALIPYNHLKVNMVDVGQGDCIYVETPHKRTILIDTGGTEESDYDVGEKILLPYLLDRGKLKVDYIFISHMHEDHAEGLVTLLEKFKVGKIIINEQKTNTELYEKIRKIAQDKGIEIMIVDAGDRLEVDGISFEILLSEEEMSNLNNTSVVMKMTFGNTSMLFTGDAEKELEELAKHNVKSTILKVGHHGSNTSTTDDFLNKISPQIAVIGVGMKNRFGHPKQEIIEKLEKKDVSIYRTDLNGEIFMKLYKNGSIKINTQF